MKIIKRGCVHFFTTQEFSRKYWISSILNLLPHNPSRFDSGLHRQPIMCRFIQPMPIFSQPILLELFCRKWFVSSITNISWKFSASHQMSKLHGRIQKHFARGFQAWLMWLLCKFLTDVNLPDYLLHGYHLPRWLDQSPISSYSWLQWLCLKGGIFLISAEKFRKGFCVTYRFFHCHLFFEIEPILSILTLLFIRNYAFKSSLNEPFSRP